MPREAAKAHTRAYAILNGGKSLNLYILRHPPAKPVDVQHNLDYMRPLTQESSAVLHRAVPHMRRLVPRLSRIWTSPHERGKQTGRIIASAYGDVYPEAAEVLDGNEDPIRVIALFKDMMGDPNVMLVGHAPSVDEVITYLVAPGETSLITRMEPGSLARLEFGLPLDRKAAIHWIIPLEAW